MQRSGRNILKRATRIALLSAALVVPPAGIAQAAEIEAVEIGLTTGRALVAGSSVAAARNDAPLVVVIGGLAGMDASTRAVSNAVERYAAAPDAERRFALLAIPAANPEARPLAFPPTGAAYRENAESYVLWRWLGLNAPDRVIVVGEDPANLAAVLATQPVAGVAAIPADHIAADARILGVIPASLPTSPAHAEVMRRRSLTPLEFANRLEPIYAQTFDPPIYINGMALLAELGLGEIEHVQALAEPYVDGTRDSLGGAFGTSSLTQAGHLVFTELAELTGDPRYLERARTVAEFGFDDDGNPLEAMPAHGEMSDAIFMGTAILAAVGDLTGEPRYFDMAVRHLDFMNDLVRRDDGLYRHSPLTDAAWGRGNGFAAIGYALTLSKLPPAHPAFDRLLGEYRAYMATLAGWQNADGTWRQVIDHPGAYHETSSTAIIGFAMQRGLNRGWLEPAAFSPVVERAFAAVLTRTDADGGFIDVSESTNKQPSLEAYLDREALAGRDQRTGSFALLFAVERR